MNQVKFKDVGRADIEVMQEELMNYVLGFADHLKNKNDQAVFMYSLGQVDTAQRLILFFRSKIESRQNTFGFSLPITQAVVLHNACSNAQVLTQSEFTRHVAGTYSNDIDHQLKSIEI